MYFPKCNHNIFLRFLLPRSSIHRWGLQRRKDGNEAGSTTNQWSFHAPNGWLGTFRSIFGKTVHFIWRWHVENKPRAMNCRNFLPLPTQFIRLYVEINWARIKSSVRQDCATIMLVNFTRHPTILSNWVTVSCLIFRTWKRGTIMAARSLVTRDLPIRGFP